MSLPVTRGLELLPGRLVWAPGAAAAPGGRVIPALDLCKHGGGKAATYTVVHYAPAACGAAFGPLGLGALLRFCRGLDAALEDAEGAVVLTTPERDRACRLNALVLLGAYMIGRCGWSMERLAKAIGTDASAKFICSWSATATPEDGRAMRVRDCWAGLEVAVRAGWLDVDCMTDDAKMGVAVSRHNLRSVYFDVTWMIPGLLMVGSDPTTVVFDPNPATCKTLLPPDSFSSVSTTTSTVADPELAMAPGRESVSSCAALSVDTVCKEYGEVYDDTLPLDAGEVPSDFASFMVQSHVGMVVRANYDDEKGMPHQSYGDEAFRDFGIAQANVRIVDTNGGLPKAKDVARMIEVCDGFMKSGMERPAVLVHCKGGFGRSVVLAACLAIYHFDVPGEALLGWIRIARPGSVTTHKQEVFLRTLGGRRDVERFSKLPVEGQDVGVKTCMGCLSQ